MGYEIRYRTQYNTRRMQLCILPTIPWVRYVDIMNWNETKLEPIMTFITITWTPIFSLSLFLFLLFWSLVIDGRNQVDEPGPYGTRHRVFVQRGEREGL